MGEDQGGLGDVADPARADGDVGQGAPPLGQQREAALAPAAQRPQQQVAGGGVGVQPAVSRGGGRGGPVAAGAVIAAVGQGGQVQVGGGPGPRAQHTAVRAAVRAWTEPGTTPQTPTGSPSGRMTAGRVPPTPPVVPASPASMGVPVRLVVFSRSRSEPTTVPSRRTCDQPSSAARVAARPPAPAATGAPTSA